MGKQLKKGRVSSLHPPAERVRLVNLRSVTPPGATERINPGWRKPVFWRRGRRWTVWTWLASSNLRYLLCGCGPVACDDHPSVRRCVGEKSKKRLGEREIDRVVDFVVLNIRGKIGSN